MQSSLGLDRSYKTSPPLSVPRQNHPVTPSRPVEKFSLRLRRQVLLQQQIQPPTHQPELPKFLTFLPMKIKINGRARGFPSSQVSNVFVILVICGPVRSTAQPEKFTLLAERRFKKIEHEQWRKCSTAAAVAPARPRRHIAHSWLAGSGSSVGRKRGVVEMDRDKIFVTQGSSRSVRGSKKRDRR